MRSLQFNNAVVLEELFESLAFTNELDFAIRVHRFGSVATAVVVTAHGGTVSTGVVENQEVAHLSLRELACHHKATFFLREHVTGFAKRASHNSVNRFVEFTTVTGNHRNSVVATVEARANEIGKASVQEVEQIITLLLDGTDFSNEVTAFCNKVTARLHFEVDIVTNALLDALAGVS